MNRIRLLPLVIAAAVTLLGLKVAEFTWGGRLKMAGGQRVEVVGIDPVSGKEVDMIVTGSAGGGEAKKEDGHGGGEGAPPADPKNSVTPSKVDTKVSGDKPAEARPIAGQELLSELEILQKLSERRKKLEDMEHALQMREDLLKASEDRIGKRVDELKSLEDKIGGAAKAKEEAKVKELADLVKMYESMKAKDAARVFDKLDIALAADLGRQMNPKKLGDIVAKMSAEQAEKLTVELANRRGVEAAPAERVLPKIQGRSG
jgi:flagellar motility protein MotE (MotC chaperone)